MIGRWITFNINPSEGKYINHYFIDGFAHKSSKSLCGHDMKNASSENFDGYTPRCKICEEKLKSLFGEIGKYE